MLLRAISPSLTAAWRPATSSQLVCTIVISIIINNIIIINNSIVNTIIINNILIIKIIIANTNSLITAIIIISSLSSHLSRHQTSWFGLCFM